MRVRRDGAGPHTNTGERKGGEEKEKSREKVYISNNEKVQFRAKRKQQGASFK